ncbi:MAG: hypothetical protein ACTHM7_20350 [Ginsengibacter sp.]
MTSRSYFPPPVRTVFIPKKQAGKRPLGIPTVNDCIAQNVVTLFYPRMFKNARHFTKLKLDPKKSGEDTRGRQRNSE